MKTTTPRSIRRLLVLAVLWPALARAAQNYTTPYYFATLAGSASVTSIGAADGPGDLARFNGPYAVAVDAQRTVYVADNGNRTIRKITSNGVVTTLAGTPGVYGATDGPGNVALFGNPWAIAVDGAGNVFVADAFGNTIRKITTEGVVTTLAGSPFVAGFVDGNGSAARFNTPTGLAVDRSGNIFVADAGNGAIRKVTPGGSVTTVGQSRVLGLGQIALDPAGNIVAPTGNSISRISPDGTVTNLAGLLSLPDEGANSGAVDGTGTEARFSGPDGVAVDANGTVYIADTWNNTIRKITPGGAVTTWAGLPAGYPPAEFSTNSTDGQGRAARFFMPHGLAVDNTGTVYVADTHNNTIREITSGGLVSTLAGLSPFASVGAADGPGQVARFASPHGTATDSQGNVYVADSYNHTIRRISATGLVSTIAGTAGASGADDATGAAARFYYPKGVAVDQSGTLYVADTGNQTIRKITPAGVVTTIAGLAGMAGLSDGTGSSARFNLPQGIAVDRSGTLYVADTENSTIRKITPGGVVTTLAGRAGAMDAVDGAGSAARFFRPEGVAVTANGTVFVADTSNYLVRQISPAGVVTTLAGQAGLPGATDGPAATAQFNGPEGVAVDVVGNVYVADNGDYQILRYIYGGQLMVTNGGNHTVRRITPDLVVSTLAGKQQGQADGIGSEAQFDVPYGIAADSAGTLYVSCSNLYSNTIRKGRPAAAPVIAAQPQGTNATAGGSAQFTVQAGGAPEPTYQWYRNGTALSGATESTLRLGSVVASDAGDYTVVVANELGTATSSRATLSVSAPAPAPTATSGGGGGGGGGAISPAGLGALGLLALLRRWRHRTGPAPARRNPEDSRKMPLD